MYVHDVFAWVYFYSLQDGMGIYTRTTEMRSGDSQQILQFKSSQGAGFKSSCDYHFDPFWLKERAAPAALCFGVWPFSSITLLLLNMSHFVALHGEHESNGPLFITESSGQLLHVAWVLVLPVLRGWTWLCGGWIQVYVYIYIYVYNYGHFKTSLLPIFIPCSRESQMFRETVVFQRPQMEGSMLVGRRLHPIIILQQY